MTCDAETMVLNMEQMQTYGKAMLENIISIFNNHEIPYFACFGTALGAVRHADIIPWDHDIDLGVPIWERERMIEVLKEELNPEFHLWTAGDDNYALLFTRVALTDKRHEFLHIDIYNIIGLPDGVNEQKRVMKRAVAIDRLIHNKYYLHFSKNNSFLGRIKVVMLKVQASLISENFLRNRFDKLLHMWDFNMSNYITIPIKEYGMKKVFNKEVFGNGVGMQFGSMMLNIPESYDFYLTQIYGDYMTYPPKKEREKMLTRKWKIESL